MSYFRLILFLMLMTGPILPAVECRADADKPLIVAQLKPKEKGNCFHWNRCRGDSIGNTLIDSAQYCATLGGKSWMREDGLCVSFPGGPQAYNPDNYTSESGGEPWPGRR